MKPLDIHITQGDSIHPRRYFATLTDPEGTLVTMSDDDEAKLIAQVAYAFIKYAHAQRLSVAA